MDNSRKPHVPEYKTTRTLFNSPVRGYCRICGKFGELTADHIPPKSCFNSEPVYVILPYHAKIDKGLKIKSICANCNTTLLGSNYDNEIKKFTSQITSHLTIFNSNNVTEFHKGRITIDKEKVLRGILGHILACYGTQEELQQEIDLSQDCYTNRMRRYVLGEDNGFYKEIRTIFWIHPYDSIRVVPSVAMLNIYKKNWTACGSLLSFNPIGIFIIDAKNTFLNEIKKFNELTIDGKTNMSIDLSLKNEEDYPFSLIKLNQGFAFLTNLNGVIHGVRPDFLSKNPREPNFFDLVHLQRDYKRE